MKIKTNNILKLFKIDDSDVFIQAVPAYIWFTVKRMEEDVKSGISSPEMAVYIRVAR